MYNLTSAAKCVSISSPFTTFAPSTALAAKALDGGKPKTDKLNAIDGILLMC